MKYFDEVRFRWYQHLIFWVCYILFWSVRDLVHHPDYTDNIQMNIVTGSMYGLLVYFNVYVLVPILLLTRKYLVYVVGLLASLSVVALTTSRIVYYFLIYQEVQDVADFFVSVRGVVVLHFEAFFVTLITLAIILARIYFIKDNDTRELIKKNLETELNFLKNQINPHFLFNSLNSIYFLIPKNQKKAAEILLKFSDMLSHQLYEGNKDFIPLENEIKYLENYMELEKVRQGDRVNVEWSVEGDIASHKVAPMLFLTFLENAFKHGQQSENQTYHISGSLRILEDQVTFKLKNDIGTNGQSDDGNKRVGLDNAKRRLELLYPERHTLKIEQNNGLFSVDLTILTNEN